MKQILPVLATFVALSAAAAPLAPKTPAEILRDIDSYEPLSRIRLASPPMALPTRSLDDPQADLDATYAEYCNYGDLLGNGTNIYMLYLTNTEISKGIPVAEGQMCRLEIIAEAAENPSDPMPQGTYTCIDLDKDAPVAGTFVAIDSDFLDAFPDPDDPESGLVAYIWKINAGSVSITINNDIYENQGTADYYVIKSDGLHGDIISSQTGEVLESRDLSATYLGNLYFNDPNAYTPLGGDVVLDIPNLSGRYMDGGGWTLTFYGVELDEDGFIIGPGDLFNVELITDDPGFMDPELLQGTFTPCDLLVEQVPGCFGQGVWMEFWGMWMSLGTSLNVYNENLEVERVGLAVEGEIVITKVSDGIHHFDFDVTTPEGDRMTGSWEGSISDNVADFSSGVDETGLGSNGAVKGCHGYIEAPEGARVFNAAGIETGLTDLAPGIYIVRLADRAVKVVVK